MDAGWIILHNTIEEGFKSAWLFHKVNEFLHVQKKGYKILTHGGEKLRYTHI